MHPIRLLAPLLLLAPLAAPAAAQAPVSLGSIFSDHMVLQRGEPVRVWGRAAPGETVTVTLDGQEATAEAGEDGYWQAEFQPHEAGGPYRIEAMAGSGQSAAIEDVLIGDVWLCSGQSNMEYPVYRALNPDSEIANSANDRMRLLTVEKDNQPQPRLELAQPAQWAAAGPDTVRDFSAVCYFFGRELQRQQGVPMGLIDASWGGSQIEAWIGAEHLRTAGDFDAELEMLALRGRDPAAASARFGVAWEDWWQSTHGNAPWEESGEGWAEVPALSDWQSWDDPATQGHLGMLWYRTNVELTAEQAASPATLQLAGIDEVDAAWVNGQLVGNTFGWGTPRSYPLPEGLLQAGENTILVNVLNLWGPGGLVDPDGASEVEFETAPDAALDGEWSYSVVSETGSPPRAPWESIGGLTTLHNAMVAPLGPIPLRGALWYQGESNAGRADQYEALLNALVANWRSQFGADLPVFVVQLPGFGELQSGPVESGWAGVREAQRQVALNDPRVGLVVAIDLGDRFDIHPPNKQAVAARAVRAARSLLHDSPLSPSGAEPAGAIRARDAVTVRFTGTGGGLVAIGDDRPAAFELCAEEAGSCRFADAELEADRVILTGPGVRTASRVRFCWADVPICNLYDATGLPVGPFEIAVSRN